MFMIFEMAGRNRVIYKETSEGISCKDGLVARIDPKCRGSAENQLCYGLFFEK